MLPFILGAIFAASLVGTVLAAPAPDPKPLLEQYCIDCHDDGIKRGGLNLEAILSDPPEAHPEIWEKVILRLNSRQMPPPEEKVRPTEEEFIASSGNFRPIQYTVDAMSEVMRKRGVEPAPSPPPPGK